MRSFGTVLGRTLSGSSSLVNVSTWERELNCEYGPAGPRALLTQWAVFVETRLNAYLNASNPVILGYAPGGPCFQGLFHDVVVCKGVLSPDTLAGLAARGIRLNPNATDTDFDGLADGQELFVKSVKTPKRYPIPDRTAFADGSAWTPVLVPGIAAPAAMVSGAIAMVGITHELMGDLQVDLHRTYGATNDTFPLRPRTSWDSSSNNFTSYDLLDMSGLSREDFTLGKGWALHVLDKMRYGTGQIEYLQVQTTVRTYPNRADTDGDGLNDSEELNLGTDGFQTDPWTADTDGDSVPDPLEYSGWSRSGSTYVANPSGFHTSPVRDDSDLDGTPDGADRWPLQDVYVSVYVGPFQLVTQSVEMTTLKAYPYAVIEDSAGDVSVSEADRSPPCTSLQSGGWLSCSGTIDQTYTIDLDDSASSVTFSIGLWQDRSRYNAAGDIGAPIKPGGSNVASVTWTVRDDLTASGSDPACAGSALCQFVSDTLVTIGGTAHRNRLTVSLSARAGTRSTLNLLVPNDYAGIYNVTQGASTYRRYVGEPRFVEVLLNGTSPTLYLVPRSAFVDTQFQEDLKDVTSAIGVRGQTQYGKMTGYQNGTSSANSDVLQMAFVFDGLTTQERTWVLDALLRNASGVVNKTLLSWSPSSWSSLDSPYLLGLPVEAIQAVPYDLWEWYSSASHPENLDSVNPPVPFWVRLSQGIGDAILETLAWIHSGLVWLGNLVVQFVQALVNFGSWVGDLTSGDPERVRNAIEAAQRAWDGFVNGLVRFAMDVLWPALAQALSPVLGPLRGWAQGFDQQLSDVTATAFSAESVGRLARSVGVFVGLLGVAYVVVWSAVFAIGWWSSLVASFTNELVVRLVPLIMTLVIGAIVSTVSAAALVSSIISGSEEFAQQAILEILTPSLATEAAVLTATNILFTAFAIGSLVDNGLARYIPVRLAIRFAFTILILVVSAFTTHELGPAVAAVGMAAYTVIRALRPEGRWGLPSIWLDQVALALTIVGLGVATVKLLIALSEGASL